MTDPIKIRSRPPRSMATELLGGADLPFSDLTDEHLEHFFFTGSDSSPTGLVGLEIYGADALLRSLVVCAPARAAGLGSLLVKHAEDYARSNQVHAIYLLTTTAESFFERRGYRHIDRAQAPPSIRRTREFATFCPASSALLIKQL
jgi:amino-acid N-acetyltransferase